MDIVPFPFLDGVALSVTLEDGRRAFWSEKQRCWTTTAEEATLFETEAASLTELATSRRKIEAAFLKRTGIDFPVQG